jgi:protocatechuate 3,4-dioxygenase beta subunit
MKTERRSFLKTVLTSGGVAVVGAASAKAAELCLQVTPRQTEGPFYPIEDQLDKDVDLTQIKGRFQSAKGEVIYIKGVVQDQNCNPVSGALVEIWQACFSGKYNHPSDPNTAELDPNFQYWGRAVTNAAGEYSFKTILPGAYPADENWIRPPHIHFKVHRLGHAELTSQLYFKGHELNDLDLVLQSLSKSEQEAVLVELRKEEGKTVGEFNITLRSLRG